MIKARNFLIFSICLGALFSSDFSALAKEPVTITLLHTNDLHSHFRPEKTPLGLGGMARLKTAIRQIRREKPNSLLVDGGDWSEGNIYYNEGAGRESVHMMDHLGIDVAVVGNHDWLNGPDVLLNSIRENNAKVTFVSANLDPADYSRADEFRRLVPPYTIKTVNGVKIAFIGLSTYELIYDQFFDPIKILDPGSVTKQLSAQLKREVDVVVVISHNATAMNEALLRAAPDVDLIIGAHDHKKFTTPVVVKRTNAKPGWVVETGAWGRYLGEVTIKAQPGTPGSVELAGYRLHQIDRTIPEDPATLTLIESLEAKLERNYGPIFHDHVGDLEMELGREGLESGMGNFTTDAYRHATHADIGVDVINFIYGEMHHGPIQTVDVFNANPGVYSPVTQKAWTVKLLPMKGRTLEWLLNFVFSVKDLGKMGLLCSSGLEVEFDPKIRGKTISGSSFLREPNHPMTVLGQFIRGLGDGNPIFKRISVQGAPLDPDRTYQLAAGGGILEALKFINSLMPDTVPLDGLVDTQEESWRVMLDYLRAMSPVTSEKVAMGNRLQTTQSDLGVLYDDVSWEPLARTLHGMRAKVHVRVRNFGAASVSAAPPTVRLALNQNGANYSIDPTWIELGAPKAIRALAPHESQYFEWEVEIPQSRGTYSVAAQIQGNDGEPNLSNDDVLRWFSASSKTPPRPLRAPQPLP